MKRLLNVLLSLALALPADATSIDPDPRPPLIQIALLLDTSNSMDGLISQAKSQLWRVVNDLSGSRCGGRAPRIEVALYEYGNSGLAAGENYVRQVLPFTRDLDRVAERLFALSTNGGEEYCGAVIQDAARTLAWSRHPATYKTLFIAGNEPFTQGDVDFRRAVAHAVERDVVVNTIFCGRRTEGLETGWKEGADRGRGEFLVINQDQVVSMVRSPYDDEIERLGRAMNDTYVSYGGAGRKAEARRSQADQAAVAAAPGVAVERSLFKAKRQYQEAAAESDAVEAVASGALAPSALKKEDLPAEYKSMDEKELASALRAKADERGKIQAKIDALGQKRAAFLAQQSAGAKDTLDQAMLDAVRRQAGEKNFSFDK